MGTLPRYEVAGTGPDHARRYTATVIVDGAVVGQGEGRSKKDAEQAAAHAAFAGFDDSVGRGRPASSRRRSHRSLDRALRARTCPPMPELPEVETIRRDLEKEVIGRRVKTVEVKGKRSIRRHKSGTEFRGRLEGRKITSVRRAGKYLLVGLDDDDILVVHLGMSGQLLRAKGPKDPMAPHTHVVITFTQGGQLRFVDPRTFGEMFVTATDELETVPELSHLGFDPIEEVMSWARFGQLLADRHTAVEDPAHGPEVRGRDRQHLLRRDPLRRRAPLRPRFGLPERPGDPPSVPGHGRDPVGGGQVPGFVVGRRAVPRSLR